MERSKRFRMADLDITHFKGSGPGGQNRNKRMTGVRVVHRPTGIVVEATERRSQLQNYENALERLDRKLEKFYHRDKPRFDTKPTKGSQRRRVEGKQKRSHVKSHRKKVSWGDD